MEDDDHDGSITMTRRRGTKISAMRGKGGKQSRSKFSSSDRDGSGASDDEDEAIRSHKNRTFKLLSSASSASAAPVSDNDVHAEAGPSTNTAALSRHEKMEALAARRRKTQGEADVPENGASANDPLIDAFFGAPSPSSPTSRSPSLDIQGSDEDEHNEAMPDFMAKSLKNAKPNGKATKAKKSKAASAERDILSDLEDDFERANARVASKRAVATKEKAPPKSSPCPRRSSKTCTVKQRVWSARTVPNLAWPITRRRSSASTSCLTRSRPRNLHETTLWQAQRRVQIVLLAKTAVSLLQDSIHRRSLPASPRVSRTQTPSIRTRFANGRVLTLAVPSSP